MNTRPSDAVDAPPVRAPRPAAEPDTAAGDRDPLARLRVWGRENPEFLAELMVRFIDHAPRDLCRLLDAVRDHDRPGAARATHKLRGMTSTIGLARLAENVTRIESEVADADWTVAADDCRALVGELERCLGDARRLIDALHATDSPQTTEAKP